MSGATKEESFKLPSINRSYVHDEHHQTPSDDDNLIDHPENKSEFSNSYNLPSTKDEPGIHRIPTTVGTNFSATDSKFSRHKAMPSQKELR